MLSLVLAGAPVGLVFAQASVDDMEGELEDVDGLQVILEQQRELKAQLDQGGIEGLTTRENNRIRKAQAQVFSITEGKAVLAELSIDEKVELENSLEQINAYVKDTRIASDEQTVCWREKPTGSKVKVTRCGTQAERTRAREGARGFLDRPRTCSGDCGGQ